jgi:hypothetical protein
MLRFHDQGDFIEIDVVDRESSPLYDGDVYLTIRVVSGGFSGHNDLWVDRDAFQRFCHELLDLELRRKGEALLEGIDPRELTVRVRAIDSRGSMTVEGTVGFPIQRAVTCPFHCVQFGIEFDPTQLNRIPEILWVKHTKDVK